MHLYLYKLTTDARYEHATDLYLYVLGARLYHRYSEVSVSMDYTVILEN